MSVFFCCFFKCVCANIINHTLSQISFGGKKGNLRGGGGRNSGEESQGDPHSVLIPAKVRL